MAQIGLVMQLLQVPGSSGTRRFGGKAKNSCKKGRRRSSRSPGVVWLHRLKVQFLARQGQLLTFELAHARALPALARQQSGRCLP